MASLSTPASRLRRLPALPAVVLLGTLALSGCSDPGAAAAGAQPATTAARDGVVYNTSPDQQRLRAEKDPRWPRRFPN